MVSGSPHLPKPDIAPLKRRSISLPCTDALLRCALSLRGPGHESHVINDLLQSTEALMPSTRLGKDFMHARIRSLQGSWVRCNPFQGQMAPYLLHTRGSYHQVQRDLSWCKLLLPERLWNQIPRNSPRAATVNQLIKICLRLYMFHLNAA